MIPLSETVVPVYTLCIAGHCTNIYSQLDENEMKHKNNIITKFYIIILFFFNFQCMILLIFKFVIGLSDIGASRKIFFNT